MAREIICNKCGKKLDLWDKQEDFSIHRHCGYGTKYDGSVINLDLCCSCFEELIEGCKISPIEEPRF